MTGPEAYHRKGVEPVLKRNGCSVNNQTAVAEGLQFVHERHLCEQTQQPERIGIVQASPNAPSRRCLLNLILAWCTDLASAVSTTVTQARHTLRHRCDVCYGSWQEQLRAA